MMSIVKDTIPLQTLKDMAHESFGTLVKAVVDINRGVMAIGGDMHADEEQLLLNDGSKQEWVWGINIYPDAEVSERIEFDSMINIRPSQKNLSRSVENPEIQEKIKAMVNAMIIH
jgi:hypothetical protein